MILEFEEDFVKYCAKTEWQFIKEQLEDGETDFIDPTTGNHKHFVGLWEMVGDFREKHGLPYIIYDPEGNPITEFEYFEILKEYFRKYGGEKE